ncbi:MAG: hypothetical protein ABRQ34_09600, partial [Smithellaceae bacterium]
VARQNFCDRHLFIPSDSYFLPRNYSLFKSRMTPRRPSGGDACETCFEETDDDPDLCRALPPTKVALDLKLELLGNSVKFGSNLL